MLRLLARTKTYLDGYYGRNLLAHPQCSLPFSSDASKITETTLKNKLSTVFPKASSILIEDISGGCGAMFQIYVETPEFKGLNIVKQHQLINEALKDEIKVMHGIRITTGVTKS